MNIEEDLRCSFQVLKPADKGRAKIGLKSKG